MIPRIHQSGDTCYHSKITRKGNPLAKWTLTQAIQSAFRFDPHWRSKYHRIGARRGKPKASAVMNNLGKHLFNASTHKILRIKINKGGTPLIDVVFHGRINKKRVNYKTVGAVALKKFKDERVFRGN